MTPFDEALPVSPRAEIIAVGSELLTPFRTDTNSLYLTRQLNDLGIEVRGKSIVGDDRVDLARLLRHVMERTELILVCGGLGPTADDVTRETVAELLGLSLEERSDLVLHIGARFTARGLRMPEVNRRQAMVPHGATVLENRRGTAPGLWIEQGRHLFVLLPGPPRELEPMFDAEVRPRLAARSGGRRIFRRVLRIAGRTESHVEEAVQPIYGPWRDRTPSIETTVLAAPGQIELHLSAAGVHEDDVRVSLEGAVAELRAALGDDVFSWDGRTLEEVVGDALRSRGWKIAVAESCTGGAISSRLTDVPGSSDYVERGFVTYSNSAKVDLLGVPDALIQGHGAVSEAVATAMAEGARQRAGVEVGVAVTGIAGPGGGTVEKPVGTVCVAIALDTTPPMTRTFRFAGNRTQIRFQASQAALDMVRRRLGRSGD